MKIWNGYGSEHSMNLVMVGQFKDEKDANNALELIENLTSKLDGKINVGEEAQRYSDEVMDVLRDLNCYSLPPADLEQLFYEHSIDIESNKIIIKTEETEVSAFLKIMVQKGAKVEVYSAHDYPDEKYGRGK